LKVWFCSGSSTSRSADDGEGVMVEGGEASSSHTLALSTAMLYGPTQPGGSLYGVNNRAPITSATMMVGEPIS